MTEPDASTRAMTLEEALAIAILLQKNGQLAEAQQLYSGIFAVAPEHPEALHFAGVLAHQQSRSDDAIALIEKSLKVAPGRADCYSNLGVIFQEQGRVHDAIAAYRRAIALEPDHANAHSNLGLLLRATGKLAEAEASYRTAIGINPNHVDAHHNLGVLLTSLGRSEEAVASFCKAVTLRPKHRDARRLMALAHCTIGEVAKAVRIYEEWLAEEPADPIARHMLAACTGRDVPPRASDEFVAGIFDSFAASFESKLATLAYRAPAFVAAMLDDSGRKPAKNLDMLDAGCGTGLCGPLVAPYARRLWGVDLSDGMLAHARAKNVYDTLVKSELTQFLRGHREAFDVIVSADTLVYFGDLVEVVGAFAVALRQHGVLIYTLEDAQDRDAPLGYRLELHGRYSHSRAYIARLLARVGLTSTIVGAELRTEAGAPVAGWVVRAAKPGSPVSLPCSL